MRNLAIALAMTGVIGAFTSAACATDGFRPVFGIGQKAPGIDATFAGGNFPTIGPNGEIGFTAALLGPGVTPPDENGPTAYGMFLLNANGLNMLSYSGAAINGIDAPRRVETFSGPFFSRSGYVSYWVQVNNLETFEDRDYGIWDLSGPLVITGQNGVPRFGFMSGMREDGRFLFNADSGIWEKRVDGVFPLVIDGMAAPALSPDAHIGIINYAGTTRDGNIVFHAGAGDSSGKTWSGMFALEGNTIVPLSISGERIGPNGPLASLPHYGVLNAHDELAIWGSTIDDPANPDDYKLAIWVREPDGTQKVLARGGEMPVGGLPGVPFHDLVLGSINDQGKVLLSNLSYGVWVYGVDGSKQVIAIAGDKAPGIEGARLGVPEGWLNNRGSVVVQATVFGEGITEQNNDALWFIDPESREWKLLLRSGQSIDTGDGQIHTVDSFYLDGALNDADQLGLFITFTDGGGAMYSIDAHEVPEPAATVLLGAAAIVLSTRRRF